jgi:acetyltransferase-like isoleucine patch superfamily enzyme
MNVSQTITTINSLGVREWIKKREHPIAKAVYGLAKGVRQFEIPVSKPLHGTLYHLHRSTTELLANFTRIFYWTPLFQSRLQGHASNLYLYCGMPFLQGPLKISIGSNCRVSGQSTITGRGAGKQRPQLIIGDNVDINWQTTIAVGSKIKIGNNVRMAGQVFLAGYPGHPMDAVDRAAGLPERDDQVGDIILENDVWLGTGVTVIAGVRIGHGSVVATGSIVTKDLPPFVLAAGNPARIIRSIPTKNS